MKIAILGTGRVGGALGSRWAQKGHQVIYGVRDPESDEVQAVMEKSGSNASVASVRDAAAAGELVLLAIPWDATKEVLTAIAPLDGKILVDCINPIKSDFSGLEPEAAPSATAQIVEAAPGAKVVKAFNTVSDATMVDPNYGDQQAAMFYCGDDAEAKSVVHQLTAELDMEPIDAGPLRNAAYLESLAMLYIHLAIFEGWGGECAFRLVKR
jgi:NADPH-dependent F420 reductase